jgi:hypothetical protein
MLWRGFRSIGFLGLLAFVPCLCLAADRVACPEPTTIEGQRVFIFPDGSIAMRTKLAVNPDGAFASYTVGDHGFTYVANGLDLWKDGRRHNCRDRNVDCRAKFLAAAARDFDAGTTEFCAFALEVEVNEGAQLTPCRAGHVIGNAKGRPKKAAALSTVTGAMVTPYASTTSLMHKVQGVHVYIDSAQVPTLVSPRSADLGRVAWVRSRQFSTDTFAKRASATSNRPSFLGLTSPATSADKAGSREARRISARSTNLHRLIPFCSDLQPST